MLVPLSWLRDFAPFDVDPVALGETFDDLGMVVESITRVGEGLDGVVVAAVVAIDPIPGADKIRRVTVDAGGPEPLQIVCGAWNFVVGDSVAQASWRWARTSVQPLSWPSTISANLKGCSNLTQPWLKARLSLPNMARVGVSCR